MQTLEKPLLTYDDVAKLLGCTDRHIGNLVNRGLCPRPMKLGRLVRFDPQAIETWISSGCPAVDSQNS